MTKHTDTEVSRVEIERKRALWRDNIPVGVAIAAAVTGFAVTDSNDPGDVVVWGVPMLALLGLSMRAEVRDLGRADEYQRTLRLEALAVGFALIVVLLFLGGLLTAAGLGDARVWLNISFFGGVFGWGVVNAVKTRCG